MYALSQEIHSKSCTQESTNTTKMDDIVEMRSSNVASTDTNRAPAAEELSSQQAFEECNGGERKKEAKRSTKKKKKKKKRSKSKSRQGQRSKDSSDADRAAGRKHVPDYSLDEMNVIIGKNH
jgi:hypothetical protein